MPRRPDKNKWISKKFAIGFCYSKEGVVYTNIHSKRRSTGLKWSESNKLKAIRILEERIIETLNGVNEIKEVNNWFKLVSVYKETRKNSSAELLRKYENAFKALLNKNFYLDDVIGIRAYLNERIEKCGLRPTTINRYLSFLKQIFIFGIDEGYLIRNPIRREMLLKEQSDIERKEFTNDEINLILNYSIVNDYELYKLVKFISLTGLRISEALNLNKSDIKPDYISIKGKGDRPRIFPLKPFPELIELIESFESEKLFKFEERKVANFHLKKVCKALNIDCYYRSFHSIRKYIENKFVNEYNINNFLAAQLMGHTVKVQSQHYAQTKNADELNKLIKAC